jgi:hypothetical protein
MGMRATWDKVATRNLQCGDYKIVTSIIAYESFGGIFKSWAATRSISDQELTVLKNVLNKTG